MDTRQYLISDYFTKEPPMEPPPTDVEAKKKAQDEALIAAKIPVPPVADETLLDFHDRLWKRMLLKTKRAPVPEGHCVTTDCLLWTGALKDGYGVISIDKKKKKTHRMSWLIDRKYEFIPMVNLMEKNLMIRHLCDVRTCIEPTHLDIGTDKDNGNDKVKDPKTRRGETNSTATITEKLAQEIKWSKYPVTDKERYKSQKERAKLYGVSKSIVAQIDAGTTWGHIPDRNNVINRTKMDKRSQRMRSMKTWTDLEWQKAEEKINNPKYSRRHESKVWNGVNCLEWIASFKGVYPQMFHCNETRPAHVVSCSIANNNVRLKSKEVRHLCGFSRCVEPKHLAFGTTQDQVKDKILHGTISSVLKADQVNEIRKLYSAGDVSQNQLAAKYGVSSSCINNIVLKKSWRHLLKPDDSASK